MLARRPDSRPDSPVIPRADCGSGLAREDGGTSNTDASWPTAFASKPAPTGIGSGRKFIGHTDPMWERACSRRRRHIQPGCKQTHRYREQARLPQGSAVETDLINDPKPVWERACSRWLPDSRPGLWEWSDNPPGCSRFFRRALAVAGWEGLSLVFSRRCKFSGRAWKPDK